MGGQLVDDLLHGVVQTILHRGERIKWVCTCKNMVHLGEGRSERVTSLAQHVHLRLLEGGQSTRGREGEGGGGDNCPHTQIHTYTVHTLYMFTHTHKHTHTHTHVAHTQTFLIHLGNVVNNLDEYVQRHIFRLQSSTSWKQCVYY